MLEEMTSRRVDSVANTATQWSLIKPPEMSACRSAYSPTTNKRKTIGIITRQGLPVFSPFPIRLQIHVDVVDTVNVVPARRCGLAHDKTASRQPESMFGCRRSDIEAPINVKIQRVKFGQKLNDTLVAKW